MGLYSVTVSSAFIHQRADFPGVIGLFCLQRHIDSRAESSRGGHVSSVTGRLSMHQLCTINTRNKYVFYPPSSRTESNRPHHGYHPLSIVGSSHDFDGAVLHRPISSIGTLTPRVLRASLANLGYF